MAQIQRGGRGGVGRWGGGQVNKTATGVSFGWIRHREREVMAQQGSISFSRTRGSWDGGGAEQSRLRRGEGECSGWWRWAGLVWVSASEGEW